MRQVGEALGVSNSAICKFMIKHNINARSSWSKARGDKRVKLEKKKLLLCTSLAIVVGKLVRCLVLLLLQFLSLCGNTILNFENIKK